MEQKDRDLHSILQGSDKADSALDLSDTKTLKRYRVNNMVNCEREKSPKTDNCHCYLNFHRFFSCLCYKNCFFRFPFLFSYYEY